MKKLSFTMSFLLGWVCSVQAAVVFVDIADLTATNQSNFGVDVNQDGTDDLSFTNNTSTGNGYVAGINGSAVLGNGGITNAARLDFGQTISSSGTYNSTYGARLSGSGGSWNVIIGDKYLGVRLNIAGQTHFGWATLNGSSNGQRLVITQVAYNDVPGEEIFAGEQSTRPSLTVNESVTVLKGQSQVIETSELTIEDPDNTAEEVTVSVTTTPVNGSLELVGAPGVSISEFTLANLIAGQLVYQHNGGNTTEDSLVFSFTDSISSIIPNNTLNFVIEVDELSPNVVIQVAGNVDEGDTLVLSSQLLAATDNNSPAEDVSYQLVNYPSHGGLVNLSLDPGVYTTRFTQTDLDSNSIVYIHDGSESLTDQWKFYLKDAVGNQSSLIDYDLTINPMDTQSPVVKNNRVLLVNVKQSEAFSAEALMAEDDESGAADLEFEVISGPSQGVLEIGSDEVTRFTQDDINQAKLNYRNTNSSGFGVDSISFRVTDANSNSSEVHTFLIYVFDIEVVLGLGEVSLAPVQFNVFPNPTVDFIQIEGMTSQQSAEIYSPQGKLQRVRRNGSQLDVQGLSQGTYVVLVKDPLNQTIGQAQFLKR